MVIGKVESPDETFLEVDVFRRLHFGLAHRKKTMVTGVDFDFLFRILGLAEKTLGRPVCFGDYRFRDTVIADVKKPDFLCRLADFLGNLHRFFRGSLEESSEVDDRDFFHGNRFGFCIAHVSS